MLRGVPLRELVNDHLLAQDRSFLDGVFDQIVTNATPRFFEQPNPQGMVPIAVAAAQEPPRGVARTLLEINAQCAQGAPPIFSVLSLNTPKDETDSTNTRKVRETVRELQPRLRFPLSFFDVSYNHGTPIGRIKKDTVDSSLKTLAELTTGRPIEDPFGIFMQDADLVRLSPYFLRRLFSRLLAGASLVQGSIRHARSIGKFAAQPDLGAGFPNMDRALWTFDSVHYLARYYWEIGGVMSLRDYLAGKGIDPIAKHYEFGGVVGRASMALGDDFSMAWTRHDFSVVSPRRAYACMVHGLPPTQMWDLGEFSMIEPYRELDLSELHDIPDRWANDMIREMMPTEEGNEFFVPIRDRIAAEIEEELIAAKGVPVDEAEREWLMQAAVLKLNRTIRAHQWVSHQAMRT